MNDRPRLIEVAFPLKQASLASVHEKNVRHGHISTLHIWPARRPLAACRAALLATLLPDPGDPVKRQALLEKIGGRVVLKKVKTVNEEGATVTEEKETLEGGVLAWGQENDQAMDEFRSLIREYYGDKAPKVLDPFAGGGAIPLEAMRLGCKETLPPPSPPPISGRKITNTVILNAAEVQSLGEEISHLTKALAGCDPQVEVRISIRSKPDKELSKAAEILEKIKPKWRF
jgi:hypothetical protein